MLGYAKKGVRAMVVRPPLIWGYGGSRQVPWIFETITKTGGACFIGAGLNVYSHVHVDDLAYLYCLALQRGVAGALYHSVAGEVNFRTIAEACAEVAKCSAFSVELDQRRKILGPGVAETALVSTAVQDALALVRS